MSRCPCPLYFMFKWVIYYFPIHDFQKRVPLQGQMYNLQSFCSKAQNGGFLFNVDQGRHCEMVRSPTSNEYLKWLFYSCLHALARFVSHGSWEAPIPLTGAHHGTCPSYKSLDSIIFPPGGLFGKLENQKDPECSRNYLLAISKLSHSGSDALHTIFCVLMTSKQKQNWGAKGQRGGTGRRRKGWAMKQDVPSTFYSCVKMLCVTLCRNNEKHVVGMAHLFSVWSWLPTTLELMLALEGPATGWPGLPSRSMTCDIHPRLPPD